MNSSQESKLDVEEISVLQIIFSLITTGDKRLQIKRLGIVVLSVWAHLNNNEIFVLKTLAILINSSDLDNY